MWGFDGLEAEADGEGSTGECPRGGDVAEGDCLALNLDVLRADVDYGDRADFLGELLADIRLFLSRQASLDDVPPRLSFPAP